MKLVFCWGFLFFGASVYAGVSPNVAVENEKLSQVFQDSNSKVLPVPDQNGEVLISPTEADISNLKAATAKLNAATSELRAAKSKVSPSDLNASAKTSGCAFNPEVLQLIVFTICALLKILAFLKPFIACLDKVSWMLPGCASFCESCNTIFDFADQIMDSNAVNCDCP